MTMKLDVVIVDGEGPNAVKGRDYEFRRIHCHLKENSEGYVTSYTQYNGFNSNIEYNARDAFRDKFLGVKTLEFSDLEPNL